MKKIIASLVLLILSYSVKYSYCAEKMEQDPKDSNKSDESFSGFQVIVNSFIKKFQTGKDALMLLKRKDLSVSNFQNVTEEEEKLAIFKLKIIFRIIYSCKKIHEHFIYEKMQESEYDSLYEDLFKNDLDKDVKYSILKRIFNLIPNGYVHTFKQPISTFNLMFSFSDFISNFVVRKKKQSFLKRIFKSEITDLNNQFFVFSFQMKKKSPWQCYYDWTMDDNFGVQSLAITNGVISVRPHMLNEKIEKNILFEENYFNFTILNIPTYLFIFSDEKINYIINTYVKNDEFIFPKFISHSYIIIGFLVHNVDKKTIDYFEVINNMVCFCNNGLNLNTEIIMNPDGEIWNNDGDVVFMLEKIEN